MLPTILTMFWILFLLTFFTLLLQCVHNITQLPWLHSKPKTITHYLVTCGLDGDKGFGVRTTPAWAPYVCVQVLLQVVLMSLAIPRFLSKAHTSHTSTIIHQNWCHITSTTSKPQLWIVEIHILFNSTLLFLYVVVARL